MEIQNDARTGPCAWCALLDRCLHRGRKSNYIDSASMARYSSAVCFCALSIF